MLRPIVKTALGILLFYLLIAFQWPRFDQQNQYMISLFQQCSAETYYVDSVYGNDAHNGATEAKAWKSVKRVNNALFKPGDQILFKCGQVWRETLVISSSGTEDFYITFGAYGTGNKPLLKGSDIVSGWTPEINLDGQVKYYSHLDFLPANVYQDDLEIPLKKVNFKELLTSLGTFYYDNKNKKIYITTINNTDPSTHVIEAAKRDYCIIGNKNSNYIAINKLSIKHSKKAGIYLFQSNFWKIYNCYLFNHEDCCILGEGGDTTITGTVIENCRIGHVDRLSNLDSKYGGIVLRGATNSIINKNYISTRNSYGIVFDSAFNDAHGSKSIGGDIYGNEITNCESNIQLHNSDNFKIYRNYIHESKGIGIGVAWNSNNNMIYYNLIYDLNINTYRTHYNGIDVNANSNDGRIFNNNIIKVYASSITIEDFFAPSNGWEIKNNICYAFNNYSGTRRPIQINKKITSVSLSNNLYFSDKEVGFWKGTVCRSLSEWKKYSNDEMSLAEDPMLINFGTNHFSLNALSPCTDAGAYVGLMQDYFGNPVPRGTAPDIGCVEAEIY